MTGDALFLLLRKDLKSALQHFSCVRCLERQSLVLCLLSPFFLDKSSLAKLGISGMLLLALEHAQLMS